MKLKGAMTINGRKYNTGDQVPWLMIYPFFFIHMLVFGLSGFYMAYASDGPGVGFLYAHGGFAILVYLIFYFVIFGRDEVKWMFINAGLGLLGIYAEIGFILDLFNTRLENFPVYVHVIPFMYYILYTFLLRQAVIDLFRARENPERRRFVNGAYVILSVMIYGTIYLAG